MQISLSFWHVARTQPREFDSGCFSSAVSQADATAMGQGANAGFSGSIAIDFGASTTRENEIVLIGGWRVGNCWRYRSKRR